MSQEDTPQAGQEPTPATEPKGEPTGKTFSEDYVKTLRDEAAANRKKAQEAQARIEEFESQGKSEIEKLTGKVGTLTKDNETTRAENARLRVALEKKLPVDLVDRLRGSTPEELAADADTLLTQLQPAAEPPPPEFDGGARDPAPEPKTPEQAHNELAVALFGAPPNQ